MLRSHERWSRLATGSPQIRLWRAVLGQASAAYVAIRAFGGNEAAARLPILLVSLGCVAIFF